MAAGHRPGVELEQQVPTAAVLRPEGEAAVALDLWTAENSLHEDESESVRVVKGAPARRGWRAAKRVQSRLDCDHTVFVSSGDFYSTRRNISISSLV